MDFVKAGLNKLSTLGSTDIEIAHRQEELQKEFLRNLRYNDVDFFQLNGYETWAKCLKLYDGDTCTMGFFLNGKPFKFRVRLADIDTAEKKSEDEAEKKWALRACDRLKELMGDDLVYIKCHKWDKYGRLLAHIYPSDKDVFSFNDVLKGEGLAYEYHGGARKTFREWVYSGKVHEGIPAPEGGTKPVDNINDSEVFERQPVTDYDPLKNANHVLQGDVATF